MSEGDKQTRDWAKVLAGEEGMTFIEDMKKTSRPNKDFEVVITVFKCENGERKNSMAQTSLFFNDTEDLLDWSDNSGVDFA